MKRKLRPVLDGPWRLIAPSPDLVGQFGDGNVPEEQAAGEEHNAVVDHHVYQDDGGLWHCWACVRATAVGRILYHWTAGNLADSPWRATDEIIRCDRQAGESIDDYHGQEWIQSPYVVKHAGRYCMFYGGHTIGAGPDGRPARDTDERSECQICLMTSPDGRSWTRHRDESGRSRVFVGPGEARDPCVMLIDGLWHCYYAGYEPGDRGRPGFYVRTSADLLRWSDWTCVHRDLKLAGGRWATECPHVVQRGGYFYLFRTQDYYSATTHVFRSENPMDFGVDDSSGKYVGQFAAAAPEIFFDQAGNEYVSSVHNPPKGVEICRLNWQDDR